MGPELRKVADTIMSDLGMGEDQGKIDALEHALEENLSAFFSRACSFSEGSYTSSIIKRGAEETFTSHIDTNYTTLLMCAMIGWYLLRELRDGEEEPDAPAEMYS